MPRNGPIDPRPLPPVRNGLAEIELTTARIKAVTTVFAGGFLLITVGQFKPLIQYFGWAFSPILTIVGTILLLLPIAYVCQVRPTMNKTTERYLAFFFGTGFLVTILVIAIFFPNPSSFQYLVFRIVLSLAASGFATMLPGFLEVKFGKWLRATGAIAVFAIVYFLNPAALVAVPQ